jgi:sugar lactone lactonase YvrE
MERLMNNLRTTMVAVTFMGMTITAGAQMLTVIAGNGNPGSKGDGKAAVQAEIDCPGALAVDKEGNMYFTDAARNSIRKIDVNGIITTLAGDNLPGYNGDAIPASAASLSTPKGIAVDDQGNIYFADSYNNRIRKIDRAGIIHTVAGCGNAGFSGNGGPATNAQLMSPCGIAVDKAGNIYFSERDNNSIRKVNKRGIVTQYAGTAFGAGMGIGRYSGDGGKATQADLSGPVGIALDANGNLYVADCNNHRVRMISAKGYISTIAGNGKQGYNGDLHLPTNASLNYPVSVSVDKLGALYICDKLNSRIWKIADGKMTTFACKETIAKLSLGSEKAEMERPNFVTTDSEGNVIFGESSANQIFRISSPTIAAADAGANGVLRAASCTLPTHLNNN